MKYLIVSIFTTCIVFCQVAHAENIAMRCIESAMESYMMKNSSDIKETKEISVNDMAESIAETCEDILIETVENDGKGELSFREKLNAKKTIKNSMKTVIWNKEGEFNNQGLYLKR